MKSSTSFVLALLVLSTLVEVAVAQSVPSAVSILPAQTQIPSSDVGDSDRYEKRPVAKPAKKPVVTSEKTESKSVAPDPEIVRPLDQASTLSNMAPVRSQNESDEDASSQVKDLIIGNPEDLDRYHSYLSPDDIRRNRVELEVAPLYIYNDSKSDYYYRNYITASPGGRIGVNVWFTPLFGVVANYEKTFLATIKKNVNGASQTPLMDYWIQIGLRFRRYTSFSASSSSLTIGVDYSGYQRKVPADDLNHIKMSTTGLLISAESRLPSSDTLAWITRVEYMPFATHKEQATAGNIESGAKSDTFRIGIAFGPEFKLNRSNRLYLKVRDIYERNSFAGTANTADPHTGELPQNVTVSNNLLIFEVGYIWGN